jgi:archaellum biogenesis ATPase FlaH
MAMQIYINMKNINSKKIAEKLGIQKAQNGDNLYHCWRKENHRNGDEKPSLVIYDDKWKCQVCDQDYGNYYDLVYEFNGYSDKDIFRHSIKTEQWLRDNGYWEDRTKDYPPKVEKTVVKKANIKQKNRQEPESKIQIRRLYKFNFTDTLSLFDELDWSKAETPAKDQRFMYVPSSTPTRPATTAEINLIKRFYHKRFSKEALQKANAEICELDGWVCLAFKHTENEHKQMIYNPNNINDRVLHFEGRSDWITAIAMGLDSSYCLVSEFNATSRISIDDSAEHIFIIDNDVDTEKFKSRIKNTNENAEVYYITPPDDFNDFAEWVDGDNDIKAESISNWLINNKNLAFKNNIQSCDIIGNERKRIVSPRIQEILDRCYIPNWNNRPAKIEPTLYLNNVRVGSPGNITTIVAGSGIGKSSVCEAVIAGLLNKDSDSLGFKVSNINHIKYFDTEKTIADSFDSWVRTLERGGIKEPAQPVNLDFVDISLIEKIEERNELLNDALDNPRTKSDLVILDNITDFLGGVNDERESNELLLRISAKAKRNNVTVLVTIHHNPQENQTKARGHVGSEIIRRAESVILLRKDQETGQRTMTMKFNEGKNRSDVDDVETYFRFDDSQMMFVSCDNSVKIPKKKKIDEDHLISLVNKIFHKKNSMNVSEFKEKIQEIEGCLDRAAAYRYKAMRDNCLIAVKGKVVSKYSD